MNEKTELVVDHSDDYVVYDEVTEFTPEQLRRASINLLGFKLRQGISLQPHERQCLVGMVEARREAGQLGETLIAMTNDAIIDQMLVDMRGTVVEPTFSIAPYQKSISLPGPGNRAERRRHDKEHKLPRNKRRYA